jgi:excisionase family DNA binding protein
LERGEVHVAVMAGPDPDAQNEDLQLYRVRDAMRLLKLSRTVIYEQLRTGRLRSVQQGRARLITAGAIRDYIKLLEDEAREEAR